MAPTPHRRRTGFTMVELAVAVAISTIVVAGLYQLFNVQSRQLMLLEMQSEMNQNLRFATDIITRTARLGGLGTAGAVTGQLGEGGVVANPLPPVISYDADSATGADAITLVHMDPSLTMNTDIRHLNGASTSSIYFDLAMHDYAAKITGYSAGEYLLCYDFGDTSGMEAYLWAITAVNTTTGEISVTSNSGFADYDALKPTTENLGPVLTCSKGEIITFYIDDDDTDGVGPGSETHPVLMMDLDFSYPVSGPEGDDVPLVDDIEDLQIAYCLADTTGVAACNDASSWVDSFTTFSEVWMIRVNLVARSRHDDFADLFTSARPQIENHAPSDDDHYYRQMVSTEVSLRNVRYQTSF